jgi:hypothetical protein
LKWATREWETAARAVLMPDIALARLLQKRNMDFQQFRKI